MNRKTGRPITPLADKCAGCLTCALRCSLRFEKTFLMTDSAIQVRRSGNGDYRISFDSRCDGCGICARYCMYGALVQQPKEEVR